MPGKFKIVVSDLHLSAGHVAEGNPLEDFQSDQEFAAFLDEIAAESDHDGAEVELIVNGDAYEMLQVPHMATFNPTRVYDPKDYHSSSEEDSARKIAIVIAAHQPFFDALRRFIQVGPPRRSVTFIKGNHDVNLHWDAVQDRIRQAVGATDGKASLLTFEERRISREGIYVEHGNQYAEGVDRLKDMEEPHDHKDPGQLAIPPGSWFVMDFFNEVERDRYWIDGVKPITALIWYALGHDFPFAARAISTLAKRLPGILKEIVFDEVEGAEPDPLADLVRKLENPAQVEEMASRYNTDEAFRAGFNAEVMSILAPTPEPLGPPVPGLPEADVLPMDTLAEPEVMGGRIQQRVHSSLHKMAGLRAAEEGVKLVVFGHTHDAGVEPLPDGGTYINSGTWTWRADFTAADKGTWKDLFEHPERFTEDRLLSYVRIDYDDAGQPSGNLLSYEPAEEPPAQERPTVSAPPSFWERLVAWFKGLGS